MTSVVEDWKAVIVSGQGCKKGPALCLTHTNGLFWYSFAIDK